MTIFSELQKVSAGAGGCGFAQNHWFRSKGVSSILDTEGFKSPQTR